MTCKWERKVTDWVDYGSTRIPMDSYECEYDGDKDVSNNCDKSCPAYEEEES